MTLVRSFIPSSKESEENRAEFWMCLSQEVLILQSEYLGILLKHVEEMNQDCFYEGLKLKIPADAGS